MNRTTKSLMLFLALVMVWIPSSYAQVEEGFDDVDTEKIAQTGMKFLTTSVDARATALGGAVTANESYASSAAMFYNPSAMARMSGTFHVGFSNTAFIEDITYNAFSVAFKPAGGNYGVFGLSVLALDYGDIERTVRANTDAGFERLGTFSPTAMAVGVGYARSFTDRFSLGGHVKLATQDLGSQPESIADGVTTNRDFKESTIAVDFGVLYNTGFRSLTLGMSARNFSREVTYVSESFELPLTFQFGLSMDLIDFTSMDPSMHSFKFSVDASRPRDFQEHLKVGGEYTFNNLLSLRAGMAEAFVSDEERGMSLGAGLNFEVNNLKVNADYSYTDFGVFDGVNRFSLALGL